MRGNLLLVLPLLLGTCVAQTANKPGADQATGADAKVKTEAVKTQKKAAQAKPKAAQQETTDNKVEAKKAQEQPEATQPKTEAQGKTEAAQANTEEPQAQMDQEPKLTSVPGGKALGMSVLGNQEAPTSLVIVPWKSSEVGRSLGISPMLDDSRQPVDKEVFMRELRYYEIRSEKK